MEGIWERNYLRKRKSCEEIDNEIRFEVAWGDDTRICDEFFAAINARGGSDIGGAELEDHVEEEEEVGDGAGEGDEDSEDEVGLHAGLVPRDGKIEVERVEEERGDADIEEGAVPSGHELGSRV